MSESIREKFLRAQPKRSEILEYPELGIKVRVKGMSYKDRTELIKDCFLADDKLDMVKMVPRAIIATFVDPINDQPIFTRADNDVILSLSPEVIESARQVIWRVIGLMPDDAEKNSETEVAASAPASV